MTKRKDPLTGVEVSNALPDDLNQPVPGTPIADAIAAAGTTNDDHPNPSVKRLANPRDPDSVMSVRYRPDGTVMPKAEEVPLEDLGPEGMPAVSPDITCSRSRRTTSPRAGIVSPTAEEVAWLNEKYPAAFDDAGNPGVDPNPLSPI